MNGFTEFLVPRWVVMWGIAIVLYAALKWLTWIRRTPGAAPCWKQTAYLFGWPGMDADQFLGSASARLEPASVGEWLFAAGKLCVGLSVLIAAVTIVCRANPLLVGWLGMIGIVLCLHFGLFHLLSCGWRTLGIAAVPLMNRPFAAESVSEFWGRRWNLAFRDLTHRFLFRPLVRPLGAACALFAGFLISGLVHEAVISLPAGGGYGLPTAYFVVQGLGIFLERSPWGVEWGLNRGVSGRIYVLAVTVIPVPLLFPPVFVINVMVPFLRALKSLT